MQRILPIDIAKGFGILMVVIGHTTPFLWTHDFIYLFHMPLFFLLSGLFFKYTTDIKTFLWKKIKGLLFPYVIFTLLFIPVKYLEYNVIGGGYGTVLSHNYSDRPLWFLLALFALNLLTYLIEFIRCRRFPIAYAIAIILALIGYLLGRRGVILPCYLVRTLLCFPFFYLGYIGRQWWLQLPETRPRIVFVVACLILIMGVVFRMQLDVMMVRVDARPWLYCLVPIAGIVATLIISGYVNKAFCKAKNSLAYLGRNSLYIFACHWPWLGLIGHYLPTFIPNPLVSCIVTTVTVIAISLMMGTLLRKLLPSVFH